MNEVGFLVLAFIVGVAGGLVNFGGLWLTVARLSATRHPILLIASSFVGRAGLALALFYGATAGRGERLAVCLLGFIAARLFLMRYWQPK